jgi:membrane protein DedA with SNARE-associated domain
MSDPGVLIAQWGYSAIFLLVVFGNMGVPLPEETVLIVAGYMAWRGDLHLAVVIAVGVVSAVIGDNIGYWLGRRYGHGALERHSTWMLGGTRRLASIEAFVARRGAVAVFVARFVPGLRFVAGPLAGALGLPFPRFLTANLLGALLYVPIAVGAGYSVGYGIGQLLEDARGVAGRVELLTLAVALVATAALVLWRLLRGARSRPEGPPPGVT